MRSRLNRIIPPQDSPGCPGADGRTARHHHLAIKLHQNQAGNYAKQCKVTETENCNDCQYLDISGGKKTF